MAITNKRDAERLMRSLGFVVIRSKKHLIWSDGEHRVTMPSSASDWRAWKNWEADLRRRGIISREEPAVTRRAGSHPRPKEENAGSSPAVAAIPLLREPKPVITVETESQEGGLPPYALLASTAGDLIVAVYVGGEWRRHPKGRFFVASDACALAARLGSLPLSWASVPAVVLRGIECIYENDAALDLFTRPT